MGHDIYAYEVYDHVVEIAYLRRGAFTDKLYRDEIYILLDCEELNSGWSGIGEQRHFTQEQIINAMKKAKENDLIEFLSVCSRHKDGVDILFT